MNILLLNEFLTFTYIDAPAHRCLQAVIFSKWLKGEPHRLNRPTPLYRLIGKFAVSL